MIWVNNKYIGVGNGIYTSADGVSWTKQSNSPKNAVLNSIYTDGKMYIATGRDSDDYQKQVIYTSSNGTSWTKRDVSSLDVHILTLYPVEGGFAGIGSRQQDNFSDTIFSLYTKNGYEYNKQLIGTTISGELSGLATNGKRTVAVGLLGTILYTDNGSTWHAAKSLSFGKFARPHLFDIAYGANKFVAVANGGVYTSADGANWSFVKVAELDEYGGLRKILWTGKFFVASDQSEGVFTSSDGIKWTKVKSVSNDWLTSMVWDGKRLVAAMQVYNNGNQYTKIVQTSNGTSWTTLATLDAIVIELGWNGERYFAVNPYNNREAWVSSDAKSWSKQPMNISSDSNVTFIKAFNGYFMTYNTNLNENYELKTSYAVSKDGKQWKEIFIPHTAAGFKGTEHHSIMSDAIQAHGKYIFAGAGGLIMSNSELQVEVPVHIKVNGKELALSAENGKPYIDNGTTYIPLKVIGDALQYTVTWHASTKSVEFDNGSQSLSFNSVVIKEGRSYVPLRKISEQLGYKVGYSNNQQEIVITIDE